MALPVRPYSAEKALGLMLNSPKASTEGALSSKSPGCHERPALAPSSSTEFDHVWPPLMVFSHAVPTTPGVRNVNASGARTLNAPSASGSSDISVVL